MPLPSLTPAGALPLGRWHSDLADVESYFVTGRDPIRAEIWSEFQLATNTLSSIVHVCACWLGGSFFSDKPQPDDIDCVYVVDERTKPTTTAGSAAFDLFTGGHKLRTVTNLRVDSFVMTWFYRLGTSPASNAELSALAERGYWDDLWQRGRHAPKGTDHPDDPLPERGYVEVTLSGYNPTAP